MAFCYSNGLEEEKRSGTVLESNVVDMTCLWFYTKLESCDAETQITVLVYFTNSLGRGQAKQFSTIFLHAPKYPQRIAKVTQVKLEVTSREAHVQWSYPQEQTIYVQNFTVKVEKILQHAINEVIGLPIDVVQNEAIIKALEPDQRYKLTVFAHGFFGSWSSKQVEMKTSADGQFHQLFQYFDMPCVTQNCLVQFLMPFLLFRSSLLNHAS